jgi:tetratricopeptide (TPR) repeat protein
MRVHGVRPAEVQAATLRRRSPRVIGALGGVLVLCAVGWFAYDRWPSRGGAGAREVAEGPGAAALAALRASGDPRTKHLTTLLQANDAIERFAEQAVGSQSGAIERGRAVVKALRARAAAEAFVRWSLGDPRRDATLVATEVLDAVSKDRARRHLYPLEVAALAVAALRGVGVPAQLAEVFRVDGERAPLDPSARLGYFAVALPGAPGESPVLFDPYGGRGEWKPKTDEFALVDDAEAIGAALAIEAASLAARNEDPATALARADAAVKLAPRSPAVRIVRGTVLLTSAGIDEGTRELEAAAQLRDDGPRHHTLAVLSLARGDRERALKEVSLALQANPDYAAAEVTLALLHMSRQERAEAQAALEKAERLEPELPAVALAWAQFHAGTGNADQALAYARRAVERDPGAIEARLVLAGIHRQAARYDEMRAEVRAILALVPVARRERTKILIRAALGPTALEDEPTVAPAAPTDLSASSPDAPGVGKLQLDHDLGSGAGAGRLKLGDDAPKLRLREPGERLDLDAP